MPKPSPAAQQIVPCKIFAPGMTCGNPIVQGAVDGQWIALILHYWGSSDGADRADVVSIGLGGNGMETKTLPHILPFGREGDRVFAEIRGGKLFVENDVYAEGEAHCCPRRMSVRRYGFRNEALRVERSATVGVDATNAQIDAALAKAPPR